MSEFPNRDWDKLRGVRHVVTPKDQEARARQNRRRRQNLKVWRKHG